jgi:hypothetical protein
MSHVVGRGRYARETYPSPPPPAPTPSVAPASEWAAALAGNLNGSPTIVVSKSITPKVTGRLVVTITAAVQNQSDSGNAEIDVSVTHGAGVLTPADGPVVQYTINDNGGGREFATIAFEVDLGRVASPVLFPVGTPVIINAVFVPLQGQSAQWLDNGIQLTIEERPSL